MGNEPDKKVDAAAAWSMPEPVFQSSEGRAPGQRLHIDRQEDITTQPDLVDPQDDIPTEPGFKDDPQEDIPTEPGFRTDDDDVVGTAADYAKDYAEETPTPPRGSGCAKTMLSLVGIVAIAAIGIICLAVYLLFYYRPASSNF